MRILIVTQKLDRNDDILGFFHRWVEEFARYCSQLTVVALSVGEYDLPGHVQVISLGKEAQGPSRRWLSLFEKLRYTLRLWRAIWRSRDRYDVVFVHMIPLFVILGAPIWKMLSKNVALWYMHKSVNWQLRGATALADLVFTASQESFRLRSPKVHVVGHGIDTKTLTPNYRVNIGEVTNILTIGRLSPIKDYETIIKAVHLLREDGYDVQLSIVGAPATEEQEAYVARLQEMITECGLEYAVRFRGSVPHQYIKPYLQTADVFVNASGTGSLDKAVLEAMACGVPVFTSNESFKRVLGNYADQLMFPPGDEAALAERLKKFISTEQPVAAGVKQYMRRQIEQYHSVHELVPRLVTLMHHNV